MKESLRPGLTFEFKFKIPENKTVPYLYPESPEFQVMPKVLATGFMVRLFEWACIQAINPHIDWPEEQTGEDNPFPHWFQPGSNICLDFHGDPANAELVVLSDGNHHMALKDCLENFLKKLLSVG